MVASPIFFYLFAGLAILCALAVVLKKNPVASAFSLVLVFFSFSAIYALLGAHLIAAIQILVYTGAVMVLFVFVIMLLAADVPSLDFKRTSIVIRTMVGAGCVGLAGVFFWGFWKSAGQLAPQGPFSTEAVEKAGGNSKVIAELMFSEFVLPFELTSVLLLAAIVGVVAIAMRKSKTDIKKGAGS